MNICMRKGCGLVSRCWFYVQVFSGTEIPSAGVLGLSSRRETGTDSHLVRWENPMKIPWKSHENPMNDCHDHPWSSVIIRDHPWSTYSTCGFPIPSWMKIRYTPYSIIYITTSVLGVPAADLGWHWVKSQGPHLQNKIATNVQLNWRDCQLTYHLGHHMLSMQKQQQMSSKCVTCFSSLVWWVVEMHPKGPTVSGSLSYIVILSRSET